MSRTQTPSLSLPASSVARGPRVTSSDVVEPATLSAEARAALIDELYEVHSQIFDGVARDAFVQYVVDSTAARSWIQLHREASGRLVGYFAVHIHEHEVNGETIAVLRSEVGILRAFRGQRASGALMVDKGIRYKLSHPFRKVYLLCSPIHPASYAMLHRFYGHIWPRPAQETPAAEAALMEQLAQDFHLARVNPADPYVRDIGWRTRQTEADRLYWDQKDDEGVQFYLAMNPSYCEGHGLLTLMPGRVSLGLRALGRILAARWRRALKALA